MQTKPTILLLADWFAPGFKAGGPIRSCVNFVHTMYTEYEIFVVSRNTDLGSTQPYDDILPNQWLDFHEGVQVWYFSRERLSFNMLKKLIHEVNPNYIYINSMFSLPFTIWPLWINWRGITRAKIILAPRGMLRPSALQYKRFKKMVFFTILKLMKVHLKIRFQATDQKELEDIYRQFGLEANARIASQLPAVQFEPPSSLKKRPQELRLVYIARIHPVKNLDFFLRLLQNIDFPIIFHIYGPVEDTAYWDQCQKLIQQLPEHIQIQYLKTLPHQEVAKVLVKYHFMVLPTLGENFGHSIFEALSLGVPVMISNQTIWQNLEAQRMGWDLPIDQPDDYMKALKKAWEMEHGEYDQWRDICVDFAKKYVQHKGIVESYRQLFN